MKNRSSFRLLAIPVIAALLCGALIATPALADDTLPPPEPTTTLSTTQEQSQDSAITVRALEPVVAEEAAELVKREQDPAADSLEQRTVEELLADLPDGSEIVVLDARGEPMPLAAEATAEAIYSGADPMWCKTGLTPGSAGCFGFSSMTAMLADLNTANPAYAVTIWIEKAYNSNTAAGDGGTDDFRFDGNVLTTTKLYALTIKGGWNGGVSTTLDPNDPSEFVFDSLSVDSWIGNVTISNILILGADSNPTGNLYGLYIQTDGAIVVDNVESSDNFGFASGAHLDSGAATVKVTHSTFSNNAWSGLNVVSLGAITLTDVTANDNAVRGAYLLNEVPGGLVGVTLNNTNMFNGNGTTGLTVETLGAITAKHLVAVGNGNYGASLKNYDGAPTPAKPISITGSGQFSSNALDGLKITATGTVTLNNLTAVGNGQVGVAVENDALGTGSAGVTIKGSNVFHENGTAGLDVESDGAISLSSTSANGNFFGVILSNATPFIGTPGVTVLGYLKATGNASRGVYIESRGAISIANLNADWNGEAGAIFTNQTSPTPKPVTLTGLNTFNNNILQGLRILSAGTVTLYNVWAAWNGEGPDVSGVAINNATNSAAPQNVSILGVSVFNRNALHGLEILTYGAVTLTNVTATNNGFDLTTPDYGSGVFIDNCIEDILFNCSAVSPKPVTINTGSFSMNRLDGLTVLATGAVKLANLTAIQNVYAGAAVSNDTSVLTTAGVVLTGVNVFNGNGDDGLAVYSGGAISVSKITANGNGDIGVYLDNTGATEPATPNVSGLGYLTANGNTSVGLIVESHGSISAANLATNENGAMGTLLENDGSGLVKGITLTGANAFNENALEGLLAYSRGPITAANISAGWNGFGGDSAGVVLGNRVDTTIQSAVTLTGTNVFIINSFSGLKIDSYGAVTMNNVTANFNGWAVSDGAGNGVSIDNSGGLLPKPVLVSGTNVFQGNEEDGLDADSFGAITVSKVTAYGNGATGVDLDNEGPVQSNVSITGYGQFAWNLDDGLRILSHGAITAANLTANSNLGDGAILQTIGISGPRAVTLTGTNSFNLNGDAATESGLWVDADGNITISNLTATNNYYQGAELDNYSNWFAGSFLTFGSVTLSGFGAFADNGTGAGLVVRSHGNVTLNRVSSDLNGNDPGDGGITVLADGSVTLVCSAAYDNAGTGLYVGNATDTGPAASLTLKGFAALLNLVNVNVGATPVTQSACP